MSEAYGSAWTAEMTRTLSTGYVATALVIIGTFWYDNMVYIIMKAKEE